MLANGWPVSGSVPCSWSWRNSATSWSACAAAASSSRADSMAWMISPAAGQRERDQERHRRGDAHAHGNARPVRPGAVRGGRGLSRRRLRRSSLPAVGPGCRRGRHRRRPSSSSSSSRSSGLGVIVSGRRRHRHRRRRGVGACRGRLGRLRRACRSGSTDGARRDRLLEHDRLPRGRLVTGRGERPGDVRQRREGDHQPDQDLPPRAHDRNDPASSWRGRETSMRDLSWRGPPGRR